MGYRQNNILLGFAQDHTLSGASQGSQTVKNSPAMQETWVLIPGLGRSPGEGNGHPLQYSSWRIPWAEEPGGLQSSSVQLLCRV